MSYALALAVAFVAGGGLVGTVCGGMALKARMDARELDRFADSLQALLDEEKGRREEAEEEARPLRHQLMEVRTDRDRAQTENVDLRKAAEAASAECAVLTDKLDATIREATGAALVLMQTLSDERREWRRELEALTAATPMFDALFRSTDEDDTADAVVIDMPTAVAR